MRFLADENIPASTVATLRSLGHDVSYVVESDLRGQNDNHLFKVAVKERRNFITKDLDFSNILVYRPTVDTGVLVIRIRDSRPGKINVILTNFLRNYTGKLEGNLVILDENKFRVRRMLPQD
ncbi:hypothetical protein SY88_22890 [Clostridiales bacterium PH28_bin88]|nr:hypothetical protein SY88_22890 [Clostridiales bacterium PH28_bin88]